MAAPAGYGGCLDSFLVPRQPVRGLHRRQHAEDELTQPAVHRKRWPAFPTRGPSQAPGIVMATSCWGGGAADRAVRCGGCPRQGARRRALTQVDLSKGEFVHTWPTFLPDGNTFCISAPDRQTLRACTWGRSTSTPANQSRVRILATDVPAVFANGQLFFLRGGTLMAQPFDAGRLQPRDVAVPVAQDVRITWYSTGVFSVSDAGVFVYRTAVGAWNLPARLG